MWYFNTSSRQPSLHCGRASRLEQSADPCQCSFWKEKHHSAQQDVVLDRLLFGDMVLIQDAVVFLFHKFLKKTDLPMSYFKS
jgi:hypothetical protein